MSTISGTITHGITLGTSGAYASPLTITATGSVSNSGTGDAIYGPGMAAWIVDNQGSVTATGSYDAVDLKSGGSVVNGSPGAATALIIGGAGDTGGVGGAGGAGGIGVSLFGGGTLTNIGAIAGGNGGYGANGYSNQYYHLYTPGGNGGAGGIAIDLSGAGYVENAGRISGGAGGSGGVAGGLWAGSGSGGAGGTGINLLDGGSIANSGGIFGGSGAAGGSVLHYSYGGHGAGGDAIDLGGGGSIANTGTIASGYGGWSGGRGGGTFAPAGAGILLAAGGNITNGSPVAAASLIEGGGGIWAFGGAGATIINYGTILDSVRYDTSGAVNLFAGGLVSNQIGGVIANNGPYGSGVRLSGSTGAAATIVNSGTIAGSIGIAIDAANTSGNTIINFGTIAGTGGEAISLGTVGNELVVIGSTNSSLQGVISNLYPGDRFDLPFLSFGGGGTATVVSNGTVSQTLQVVETAGTFTIALDPNQSFSGDVFQLSTDSGTGTLITEAVCFCRGTLILTGRGEVAVEELAVGDRVKTLSGALKPIRWIGFGRDLVTRRNSLARPVIVRKGALADGVPRRDLYLTHGHSLYLDGVLIPVENLVNHRTILWDDSARVVEYYHIELDDHDVLFAEGAPAESYYDTGNRAFFQSARAGSEAGSDKPTCAPVLNSGEIVEAVWARLFERAGGMIEWSTTGDPDVHLRVDGERLDPTIDDSIYRFALTHAPFATLRLRSRRGVLSLLGIDRSDHRRLGVPITRIVLWHAGIPTCFEHDARQLREGGCHLAENGYCWTDGDLELPARFFTGLVGAFTLAVHTKRHYMRYPIAAPAAKAA